MNTVIQHVPDTIAKHLAEVTEKFGLEPNEDMAQKLQDSWLLKKEIFENKMIEMGMEEIGIFDPTDERGAIFLTYSGSLISVSPLKFGERTLEYTSIGYRTDVPESLELEHVELADYAEVDKSLNFKEGPIKQTSPLFKIVVTPESLSEEEQTNLVDEAATIIVDTFVGMNKNLLE